MGKVTSPKGGQLYLGGSVHALRSGDYPLPPAYNRAFDAATRIVFEVDGKALARASKELIKAGRYKKGDSLKNHVDPRTYDYVRRVFALMKVPEAVFSQFRPWLLVMMLDSPTAYGLSANLGVERFLGNRARATSKPVSGLESAQEHAAVYSGLTDRQSEALLLLTFIPSGNGTEQAAHVLQAWRRGDADDLARMVSNGFKEFPAFGERILEARNRRWISKIESYLRSGKTYFVVAGAGHMGGPEGVVSLLRARGYQVEQL
ncbi:MAG: TraB/GumN family protein [Verrucomicrobiota bacterium]|nr:TraB/GumN family protein [Verrucomicrobiota bacterium]